MENEWNMITDETEEKQQPKVSSEDIVLDEEWMASIR